MTIQPIIHKSTHCFVSGHASVLETSTKNGVNCVWIGEVNLNNDGDWTRFNFSWKFDWSALKEEGIDGLSGHITVYSRAGWSTEGVIDVDLTETNQTVSGTITPLELFVNGDVSFEYSLIPHRTPIQEEKVSYDEMFFRSGNTDAILLVDGKKLHVNKGFLSTHSDFFRALFSSNFKEGQMDEIPIEDVSYEDFGLVMSVIYPETVFPNDKTVEKFLELSDRFIMPSVIRHVEYHLLHNSKIGNVKIMWMADRYCMKKLMKKCIQQIDTKEKAKRLKADPNWKNLSKETIMAVFDRLMQLI